MCLRATAHLPELTLLRRVETAATVVKSRMGRCSQPATKPVISCIVRLDLPSRLLYDVHRAQVSSVTWPATNGIAHVIQRTGLGSLRWGSAGYASGRPIPWLAKLSAWREPRENALHLSEPRLGGHST
jgi:hypothetical protein